MHQSINNEVTMTHIIIFFFPSRRRNTRWTGDWSSDVCSSELGDRNGIDDPAPPLTGRRIAPTPPQRMAAPEMGEQFLLQRAARLDIERAIDRLVGDVHIHIRRILAAEPARDLLRRPLKLQLRRDKATQLRLKGEATPLRTLRPPPCPRLGIDGSVAGAATVPSHLATDRRCRP